MLLQLHAQIQIYAYRHKEVAKIWLNLSPSLPLALFFFFFSPPMTGKLLQKYQSLYRRFWVSNGSQHRNTLHILWQAYVACHQMNVTLEVRAKPSERPLYAGAGLQRDISLPLCCDRFACFWQFKSWSWGTWYFLEELKEQGSFPLNCRTL